MENSKKLHIFIVVLVLLNIGTLYTVTNLNKELSQIKNEMNNIFYNNLHSLEAKMSHLQGRIEEIYQDSKWVSSYSFHPNNAASKAGAIQLDLEWNFREIEKDAVVILLYKAESSSEWNEVQTKNLGGNIYTAPLILDPKENYEYQITSKGNVFRSEGIAKVPENLYKPGPVQIIGDSRAWNTQRKKSSYNIYFAQLESIFYDFYQLESADAEIYINGKLAKTIGLKPFEDRFAGKSNEELKSMSEQERQLYKETEMLRQFQADMKLKNEMRKEVQKDVGKSMEFFSGTILELRLEGNFDPSAYAVILFKHKDGTITRNKFSIIQGTLEPMN